MASPMNTGGRIWLDRRVRPPSTPAPVESTRLDSPRPGGSFYSASAAPSPPSRFFRSSVPVPGIIRHQGMTK